MLERGFDERGYTFLGVNFRCRVSKLEIPALKELVYEVYERTKRECGKRRLEVSVLEGRSASLYLAASPLTM